MDLQVFHDFIIFTFLDMFIEHTNDGGNYTESGNDIILNFYNNTMENITLVGGIMQVNFAKKLNSFYTSYNKQRLFIVNIRRCHILKRVTNLFNMWQHRIFDFDI